MNTQKPTPPTPSPSTSPPPPFPFAEHHRNYLNNPTISAQIREALAGVSPLSAQTEQILFATARANAEGVCALPSDFGLDEREARRATHSAWQNGLLYWITTDGKGLEPAYYLSSMGAMWVRDRGVEPLPPPPPPPAPKKEPALVATGRQLCLFGGAA